MGKPGATLGCYHTCPVSKHVGGPIINGSANVFYENRAASRVGDGAACATGMDQIVSGSTTVYINGLPSARQGDASVHGGRITQGVNTVFIG